MQRLHKDLAVSCGKLGCLNSLLPEEERREYLSQGLKLLTALMQTGRIHASLYWTAWYENTLCSLR